ncbi:MAG: FtsK/SpoIIIE domain-containing protein [Propionicimonas sp.]
MLWVFDPARRLAQIVRNCDPFLVAFRGRAAGMLSGGVRPWDLDLEIEWAVIRSGAPRPAVIRVRRMPPMSDPSKRAETWTHLAQQLLGQPSGTKWQVDDDPQVGRLTVRCIVDPLLAVQDYPWDAKPTLKAIPFAVDECGRRIAVGLLESNLLIGGIPGSGKSGGATAFLTGVGQLANVALIGIDLKRVELSLWEPRFSRIATDGEHADEILKALLNEMGSRYQWLKERQKKKFAEGDFTDRIPLLVVMVDELAILVAGGTTSDEKAAGKLRASMIQQLVAMGRAAGIVVVAATQKPSGDTIPTSLRDIVAQRVGYATTNKYMTDTILGDGMSIAAPCQDIPAAMKGVCYLVNETSRVPVRARTYWIPDEQVGQIAQSGAHLRVDLPWLPRPGEAFGSGSPAPTVAGGRKAAQVDIPEDIW